MDIGTIAGYMAPERKAHVESEETSLLLGEWLRSHGIQAVLFDFDDTLLATSAFVEQHKTAYKDYLADRLPRYDRTVIEEAVEKADLDVYATHSVGKTRWDGIVALLRQSFPDADPAIFSDGAPILQSIFVSTPKLHPGAKETVELFRDSVPKLGLVTHADRDWTNLKLKRAGLETTFDHVEVVDQYKYKEAADWKAAIDALGVAPSEALVIGDSVAGDIRASREAGVRYIVALPSPWEMYRRGDLPDGVIRAPSIDAVIDTLLASS